MTNPTPLSPAAQAVLDALSMDELNGPQQLMARAHAAAALRAAADQSENLYDQHDGKVSVVRTDRLIAIAAELECTDG